MDIVHDRGAPSEACLGYIATYVSEGHRARAANHLAGDFAKSIYVYAPVYIYIPTPGRITSHFGLLFPHKFFFRIGIIFPQSPILTQVQRSAY